MRKRADRNGDGDDGRDVWTSLDEALDRRDRLIEWLEPEAEYRARREAVADGQLDARDEGWA